jgi:hypothetical protein
MEGMKKDDSKMSGMDMSQSKDTMAMGQMKEMKWIIPKWKV